MKKIIIAVLLVLTFSLDAFSGYKHGPSLETAGTRRKKARIEKIEKKYKNNGAYAARKEMRTLKGPSPHGRPKPAYAPPPPKFAGIIIFF